MRTLWIPAQLSLRTVLAEMNRAERATHKCRMNWNPARAPLTPIQKRYLATGGLYCVMYDVVQFERTDSIIKAWLAFRDSARTAAAWGVSPL
jgi:hypothetical protein